jgi:hypothetical protein
MMRVGGNAAGDPRIDATFWLLPDSLVRKPEVRTSLSGRAPRAMPSAARMVPLLVATTVTGLLIAAM